MALLAVRIAELWFNQSRAVRAIAITKELKKVVENSQSGPNFELKVAMLKPT
jgi:hypothetical protein